MTLRKIFVCGVGLFMSSGLQAATAGLTLAVPGRVRPSDAVARVLAELNRASRGGSPSGLLSGAELMKQAPTILDAAGFDPEAKDDYLEVLQSSNAERIIDRFLECIDLWAARYDTLAKEARTARHQVFDMFAAKLETIDLGIGRQLNLCRRMPNHWAVNALAQGAAPTEVVPCFFVNVRNAVVAVLRRSRQLSVATLKVLADLEEGERSEKRTPSLRHCRSAGDVRLTRG